MGESKAAVDAALKRSRFEGDPGSVVETFLDDGGRRLLVVGTGSDVKPGEAAEKLGGTAVARLLTSGETNAVIDLTGLGYDADAAARVALAAALRSWRYDRYRTRLKDKQKPTLTSVTVVGAGTEAEQRYESRYAAAGRWRVADPRTGHRTGQHHLSGHASSSGSLQSVKGLGLEVEVLDRAADGQAWHGRPARRCAGFGA